MKTLKFLLVSLFMMLGLAAQAQQVVITKTDGTVDVFQPNEVDSVVYKPAPTYYYYAGWECPRNEEELASRGTLIGTNYDSFVYSFVENPVGPRKVNDITTADYYYVIIPVGMKIYDQIGTNVTSSAFVKYATWSNHIVYKSVEDTAKIKAIIIKK